MAMDSAKTPVNGHEKQDEPGVTISGSTSQAPMIDDSLIADDDEGLPLISAVFSLADGKTDETTFSGAKLGVSSSISTTGSSQIITLGEPSSLNSTSPVKDDSLRTTDTVTQQAPCEFASSEFERNGSLPTSERLGNNRLETCVNRAPSLPTNLPEGTNVTSESHQGNGIPRTTELRPSATTVVTKTPMNLQSSGNVLRLVKLVNSVSNVEQPQKSLPLTSPSVVNNKSPPSGAPNTVPSGVPGKPATHLPRQIVMKQPLPGSKQTSIILNLKPGEPIPKAINLLAPDGKSVVSLSLADGGKQLATPSGFPHTGGKILIPIPSNLVSAPLAPKQIKLVNKVYPIAPHPVKTTAMSSQGIPTPLISSISPGTPHKPPVASSAVDVARSTVPGNISGVSESLVATASKLGSTFCSSSIATSVPTKITPPKPKPLSSESDKSTGLSPQEAKIQRLKELIKHQEDAVNKLREKRRLEIERIRDPSLTSKLDSDGAADEAPKTERPPLIEEKRPSSPFAVPLPPKKRIREYDTSFKSSVAKARDSSTTPSEGAFIPNGDDKSFVQLVGLENVVNNMK